MDIYELRETLQHKYPTKAITFLLTPQCHAKYEVEMKEGKIHHTNHALECNKVEVHIEGMTPYVQDLSLIHRENVSYAHLKQMFDRQTKGHVTEEELRNIKKLTDSAEQERLLDEIALSSLETKDDLKAKMAPIVMQPDPPAYPNLDGLSDDDKARKIAEYEAAAQAYNAKYEPSGAFKIELNPTDPTPTASQPSQSSSSSSQSSQSSQQSSLPNQSSGSASQSSSQSSQSSLGGNSS